MFPTCVTLIHNSLFKIRANISTTLSAAADMSVCSLEGLIYAMTPSAASIITLRPTRFQSTVAARCIALSGLRAR